MSKTDTLVIGIIIGMLVFTAAYLLLSSESPYKLQFKSQIEINDTNPCMNMSFKATNHCLNRYIKSIYLYNDSIASGSLNLEVLRQSGGDCRHWSNYYCRLLQERGFDCTTRTLITAQHRIAISEFRNETTNKSSYCVLDQENIGCINLGDGK